VGDAEERRALPGVWPKALPGKKLPEIKAPEIKAEIRAKMVAGTTRNRNNNNEERQPRLPIN